ncbi:MAG: ECF-type sigma factor [Bryobacteraceae bacterium]
MGTLAFNSDKRMMLDRVMPALYADLRRLAQSYMQLERREHTLQPTALVHEAYLRMARQRTVDWNNRAQLLAVAARMMRRILLDHAALRNAAKRAGGAIRVSLSEDLCCLTAADVDIVDLDRALAELNRIDPLQAGVVELRFFGGLTNDEIAEALETSPITVRRRWASARLWLTRHLAAEGSI